MRFTTVTKNTDDIIFGTYNATALNRQVRIRFYPKNADGSRGKRQTLSARQLFLLLGEERTKDVLARFDRFRDDGDFSRKFRKLGEVRFNWR